MSRRGRVWQEGRAKDAPAIRGAPWYFVVDAAPVGAKRRQVFRRGFATREAAQSALDELLGSVRSGTYVEPSRATLGEYLALWLDGLASKGRRPTTIAGYRAKLDRYVFPNPIAAVPLQHVNATALDKVYSELVTEQHLSLPTVRHVHQILGTALAAAERGDLIARNPARRATPPSATSARAPEAKVWSPDELRGFLEATRDHHHHALFRLAAMTGLRRGEVCGLRWAGVDLDAGRLVVRRTITTVDHQPVAGDVKTARSRRSVDLDPETVAVLRRHQARQLEERMLVGAGYTNRDPVFAAADGSPWNPDSIGRAFARAVARTDFPRVRLHDLRHGHATHLIAAGTNPRLVSDRLGHASLGFTLQVYGHCLPGQQADAAAAVATLVDGPKLRAV